MVNIFYQDYFNTQLVKKYHWILIWTFTHNVSNMGCVLSIHYGIRLNVKLSLSLHAHFPLFKPPHCILFCSHFFEINELCNEGGLPILKVRKVLMGQTIVYQFQKRGFFKFFLKDTNENKNHYEESFLNKKSIVRYLL